MQLSADQDIAAKRVHNWLTSGSSPVFHFFGYAGTGKTTLAKYLASGITGDVLFAAFTGKAASVLRNKGCPNASTIHSLIYHSRDKSRSHIHEMEEDLAHLKAELRAELGEGSEEFVNSHKEVRELTKKIKEAADDAEQPNFILNRESVVNDASLVVIDECSMVDARMGEDLMSFGTPILVLGDPAQLPPIAGGGYFTENVHPDVMLENIHRQAGDSPIIRMATDTRNQKSLQVGNYGEGCEVIPVGTKLDPERMLNFDQVIVGKNKTRRASNKRLRQLLGYTDEYPVVGDRLVCLKNNHDLGLLNGGLFNVTSIEGVMDRKVFMTLRPDDSQFSVEIGAHEHYFLGKEDELQWFEKGEAEMFDFGYALTCHKSQGSQWNNICVFDESRSFRDHKWRWLYTAITRAAEEITVVRM